MRFFNTPTSEAKDLCKKAGVTTEHTQRVLALVGLGYTPKEAFTIMNDEKVAREAAVRAEHDTAWSRGVLRADRGR